MKKFIKPEIDLEIVNVCDVLTISVKNGQGKPTSGDKSDFGDSDFGL